MYILETIRKQLGPHAGLLLDELLFASRHGMDATVIILSAAVLDVALRENAGDLDISDGIKVNAVRDSRDAYWLRSRRNGIVHYEGGQGGLMDDTDFLLAEDSKRALKIVTASLENLL